MGYSRQQFYVIRRNFQTYGAEGLIDRLPARPSKPLQKAKGEPLTMNPETHAA